MRKSIVGWVVGPLVEVMEKDVSTGGVYEEEYQKSNPTTTNMTANEFEKNGYLSFPELVQSP